ncbi:sugar transferase [candidate division KSB1 bacterium]|nr:sugar transferase [candidate division KSB1 bacterium]
MVKEKETFQRQLIRVLDAIVIIFAFVVSYYFSDYVRDILRLGKMAYAVEPSLEGMLYFSQKNITWISMILPILIILLSKFGMYKDFRTRAYRKTVIIIIKATAVSFFALSSIIFIEKSELTSRFFIGLFTIVTMIFLTVGKKFLSIILELGYKRGYNQINILVVGTGRRAREFIRTIDLHRSWGLRIVGLIDDEHNLYGKKVEGYRVLGRIQDIPSILHWKVIDRVIFVVPRLWLHRIDEVILACEREGIPTAIAMDLYDLKIAKIRQTNFGTYPLLEFETFSAREWELFIKRLFDIVVSVFGLLVVSPIFLLTALAIKLTSPGPVFFKQIRSGLNGRKFWLYKFRSMHVNAEMKKRELLKANEMDGPVFKMKRDPRITRVGRFIRKFSIDELPQLINVLKGDMSIVGPRPPLPVEVEMYQLWQRRRLSLRPGLTCIWQVSGRNKLSFTTWMEMDLRYIDEWSLWMDLKIFIKTFFVVMFGYGAS